jgi:uncharacterized protein YjbI with pentapeptide repeats
MHLNKIYTAILLTVSIFFSARINAENPAHVQQLLSTGECQSCNLEGADLSNAQIFNTNISVGG